MENPDTVIELHRSVVEEMFVERVPPTSLPPRPFEVSVIEGPANLHIAVSRVWFHVDADGRRWRQRDGATATDADRHLAFDLRLGDHPRAGAAEFEAGVHEGPGPAGPLRPATTCNGREIRFNEIPLFGRLVVHDSLERVETTIDGRPHQNVVLEFAQQPGPTLEAEPSPPGVDSRMFGPDVQPQPGGRVLLSGWSPTSSGS